MYNQLLDETTAVSAVTHKVDTELEMTETKKTDATRDLDNISEAETIKDDDSVSHEGKNSNVNDDTENADVLINMEESTV